MEVQMYNQYISWEQYNQYHAREWLHQQEQVFREMLEDICLDIVYDSRSDLEIPLKYCYNCEKNCVIELDGYTKCIGCKDILCTDLKQIRKTYNTKSIQNKITHFTNTLNEYLKDTKFYEVQQIVDVFKELIEFMRASKKVGEKLPNINAKFFIEKILVYLGLLSPYVLTRSKKKIDNNEIIWYQFTQYKLSRETEDLDMNPPQCLNVGVFPSNSIKSVSMRL